MDSAITLNIEDLGYSEFFESNRKQLKLDGFPVARVIAEHKGVYILRSTNGKFSAKVTGKQMFIAESREDYPAVGDWVAITELEKELAVIHNILPRTTIIKRISGDQNKVGQKDGTQIIATNVDVMFIVESVNRDYSLNRFERYLAIARIAGVKPAIIINKIDLISKDELDSKLAQIKDRITDVDIITTSTVTDNDLGELKKYIAKGKTYCFLGSSGVGKSSLINKLLGENVIRTETISSYSGRGKHSTTSREIYVLENGGIVIDNPGMREVAMTDSSQGTESFDEITAMAQQCKYTDCTHVHEPGCEVLIAVKSGKLGEEKYLNYLNLKRESEYNEMNGAGKRQKDRRFGQFIKKAKEKLKKIGKKNY